MSSASSIWVCAGTFDPITNGHLDVIERARVHAGELVVAVVDTPAHKSKGLLSTAARVHLAEQACAHLPNVSVQPFTGLLTTFARGLGATGLVRGLRTVSDYEYELGIGQLNRVLDGGVETFYILADPQWSFCSSSTVRELHRHGADLTPWVPACVADHLAALR